MKELLESDLSQTSEKVIQSLRVTQGIKPLLVRAGSQNYISHSLITTQVVET